MRLIDKDSLTEHMRKAYKGNKKNGFKWDLESTVVVIECEEEINQPIVRCKDCKYCDRHHLVDGLFCYRLYEKYNKEYPQMIIEVDADDFCSRGERK